ncbi:MAG: ABC transporter ATP-binding protein [Bacteroidales bacterium]|nr:ABC transporter ATP-binding protein [Bacteroidales bacterium]MBO7256775.1 ABC transporter ATP-binding protein [Bacteroidales bacterium]MBO7322509.1 ABC transporter ATP-binding protein [Bacteroidales bacterium]
MITAQSITKRYGSLEVLKGIDFCAKEKEIISIVGASGAGKSTLLQILGSLSKPDSGKVLIDNTDIFSLSADKLSDFRNRHIGFVFQFHHLLPEFTALENVMIPALIAKDSPIDAKKRAVEILKSVGLGSRLEHKPSELSGGEQQRVAIARAIINNPSVIFADEPSGNLDSQTKGEIHRLFFDLRDLYGQTIIIVTHDNELAQMSDRILKMKDGLFI